VSEEVAKTWQEDLNGAMKTNPLDAGDWSTLESLLPPWRAEAERAGLLKRTSEERLELVLRVVLLHVATGSSLKVATAMSAAGQVLDLSAVALHQWMKKLGPLFASMLTAMTDGTQRFAAELWSGYVIYMVDASTVCRPGSKGTTARVHSAMRLSDLQCVHIEVTDERGGETFRRFRHKAGSGELWIGDRGYANPPGIAALSEKGSDVLVRYNRGSLPLYDAEGKIIELSTLLGTLVDSHSPKEWPVWVHSKRKKPIEGRLVAVRLPPEKAEEARVRLRREYGKKVSAESLSSAEFVMLFTTVPTHRLSAALILKLYTLRWQIELGFKRDKSIAGLDRLPNFRPDTIYTWIVAKMLLTQITRNVATDPVAFPPSGQSWGRTCAAA